MWCSLYAETKAMTTLKRGVSDLGCGRGHDRRRGQISWSLTPRSPRCRGDDRGDGERSATHADHVLGTRSLHRTSTCSGGQKSVRAGWLESDRRGTSQERGTPRVGPCSPLCSPGNVSRLRSHEPQKRVCRRSERSAWDFVRSDGAFLLQFANQFVEVLRQPPLRSDRVV